MVNSKTSFFILMLSFVAVIACDKPPDPTGFESSGCSSGGQFATGEQTMTSEGKERVYYLRLPVGYDSKTPYPLVFGFHGQGGNHSAFSEEEHYNLQTAIGEEAILIYPNALSVNDDVPKWDDERDLRYFEDLYKEIESNICFDIRQVFAVGHSNGGGFTHTLGCQAGDVLRAIAPVSGAISDYSTCIGQVAAIQVHGGNDTVTPLGLILPTREYWVAINSCNNEETSEGIDPVCEAYAGCDTDFPVQYCQHEGGHEWADFTGDAIWDFFKSLPLAAPSDETGTGDVDNLGEGTISFKVHYPSDFVGTPNKMALSLRPADEIPPFVTAPSYALSSDVPLGDYKFGETTEYNNVKINLSGVPYDDYWLTVTVYVEGSSYPIPASGIDYQGLQQITIDGTTIVVEETFELEFI